MGDRSRIEWTEATWNPVTGCSKVSPGCAHCYAETVTARFAGSPGWISEHRPWTPENAEHNVRLHPERLDQPLRWRRPRMVFVNSMSDLFHELVPDEFIARVFNVMAGATRHTFQVLTKRPERAAAFVPAFYERVYHESTYRPIENIWLGVSIENARYTWRADVLREIPAAVRFISAEPLLDSLLEGFTPKSLAKIRAIAPLEPVRNRAPLDLTGIDWLIVGGESGGRHARPMHPEWARELRDACMCSYHSPVKVEGCSACDARPAFFFKQWGSYEPVIGHLDGLKDLHVLTPAGTEPWQGFTHGATTSWDRQATDGRGHPIYRYAGASPKSGGRLLDGREWNEMPPREVAAAA